MVTRGYCAFVVLARLISWDTFLVVLTGSVCGLSSLGLFQIKWKNDLTLRFKTHTGFLSLVSLRGILRVFCRLHTKMKIARGNKSFRPPNLRVLPVFRHYYVFAFNNCSSQNIILPVSLYWEIPNLNRSVSHHQLLLIYT